jgi:hypothetical protein
MASGVGVEDTAITASGTGMLVDGANTANGVVGACGAVPGCAAGDGLADWGPSTLVEPK